MPHIVKEDGKKLSKRSGDASFQDLVARGYLPRRSLIASRCSAGTPATTGVLHAPGTVEAFDIDRINKSSAGFSIAKLDWLNGEHMRALAADRFYELALPYYPPEWRAWTCRPSAG